MRKNTDQKNSEYGHFSYSRSISAYSVRMRENMHRKNSEYGHFSCSVCADVTRDVQIKDVDTHSHLKIYCQKTTVVLINSKWHDQIAKPKLRLINDWRNKLKSCSICNFDGVFLEIYFGLEISLTQEVQIHKRVRTEKPLNTMFLSKPLDHNRFYWKLFFLFLWNL